MFKETPFPRPPMIGSSAPPQYAGNTSDSFSVKVRNDGSSTAVFPRSEVLLDDETGTTRNTNEDSSITSASDTKDTSDEGFEVSRLVSLIIHRIYSYKELFLWKFVSNQNLFLGVTYFSLLSDGGDWEVRIKTDPDARTITIIDTVVGMTRDELDNCLSIFAQNGTSKHLKVLKENGSHSHRKRDRSHLSLTLERCYRPEDAESYFFPRKLLCQGLNHIPLPCSLIPSTLGLSDFDDEYLGAVNEIMVQSDFSKAFVVAEKVSVSSKSPKSDKHYLWEIVAGSSSCVIKEETDPGKMLKRGTHITIVLKRDYKYALAEPSWIGDFVKTYSQLASFPIYIWREKLQTVEVEEYEEAGISDDKTKVERKKKKAIIGKYWAWEVTNETKPIWMRKPDEIEKTEYNEFYKKTFNEFFYPLAYTHFATVGEVEFRSILYIPATAPVNDEEILNPETKNIRLYVQRVFISDDFGSELFPRFLRFIKGVVDSKYPVLYVSHGILGGTPNVITMHQKLVREAIYMIEKLAEKDDKGDYNKFWENYGKCIKLGCIEETRYHNRLAPLLRFHSYKTKGDMISLDQYVENMCENQKAIYYIVTDSLVGANTNLFLGKLAQKGIEVLILEPIDEEVLATLETYKEKDFARIIIENLESDEEMLIMGYGDLDIADKMETKGERILDPVASKTSTICGVCEDKQQNETRADSFSWENIFQSLDAADNKKYEDTTTSSASDKAEVADIQEMEKVEGTAADINNVQSIDHV